MSEWDEQYEKVITNMFGGLDNYLSAKLKVRRPMINQVVKHAGTVGSGKPIIECGAGTGKLSAFFAHLGYDAFAIDIDDSMLQVAKEMSDKISPTNPVKLMNADIKNIPFDDKYFSVAHSHGVLEHFSDAEIREIIREELRIADTVVLGAPSPYFAEEEKMHGDERYLPRKKWRELIVGSNANIIAETGMHVLPFHKRLQHFARHPEKIFAPKAIHLFTIKDKV